MVLYLCIRFIEWYLLHTEISNDDLNRLFDTLDEIRCL